MTDDLYYRKMESTSTTDLVDMIRERDERIAELEKDNAELKGQCSILDKSLITSTKNNIERQKIIDELKVALRNVIDYLGQFCSDYQDCIIEAEQFLKEVKE